MSKCQLCKKKINMLFRDIYFCRCKNYYCSVHMHNHNCCFNYKQLFVDQNNELIEIKAKKVDKI